MNGVLVINKPGGFTSFDVVAVARRLTGQKKVGHTGTLDPMATGVLPLLLGNATRAQTLLPDTDKAYVAGFSFGASTDTLDSTGKVLAQSDAPVEKQALESALSLFRGAILQTPPMYSAVKKDGVRLYDLARRGIEVQRDAKKVYIHELGLLSYEEATRSGTLFVRCSKGTYIRSLIDDLAKALHTLGIMTSLQRTEACGFSLEDSLTLDEARALAEEGRLLQRLRPTQTLFSAYSKITVTPAQAKRFANGGELSLLRTPLKNGAQNGALIRVFAPDGAFLGLGEADCEKQALLVRRLFCTG